MHKSASEHTCQSAIHLVPHDAAELRLRRGAGATQLTLPGVFHTPIGAVAPTTGQVWMRFCETQEKPCQAAYFRLSSLSCAGLVLSQVIKVPRPWYGSPGVLERWIDVAIPDAPRSEAVDTPPQGAQINV